MVDVEVLSHWLQQNGCYAKNYGREFSNGILVARLLKRICPKLVDLHNYAIINNTPGKIENWKTLNNKVLKRIGIIIKPDMMWQLAMGNREVIIWLLISIMHKAVYQPRQQKETLGQINFKNKINEFGHVNKMYKRVLGTIKNKIKELEGSLRTIDQVYAKSLNKCYLEVLKKDFLHNKGKLTRKDDTKLIKPHKLHKPKVKLVKHNRSRKPTRR